MVNHSSATQREEEPHATKTSGITINKALTRRAQSIINDKSIDAQSRTIIRYSLEINDPWLAELVRGVDEGKTIVDTIESLAKAPD